MSARQSVSACLVSLLLFSTSPTALAEPRKATFAGGCFWCMEPPYDELPGVISTVSGYAGGEVENPTYEQVSAGKTGHQEVVQITYDDSKVSYKKLLEVFWQNVDPFDQTGQFCDKGEQYLSGIFYHDEHQKERAEASKERVAEELSSDESLATFIEPLDTFYPAEDYHQDFYEKNPLRYKYYRWRCGRDARLETLWGAKQDP